MPKVLNWITIIKISHISLKKLRIPLLYIDLYFLFFIKTTNYY